MQNLLAFITIFSIVWHHHCFVVDTKALNQRYKFISRFVVFEISTYDMFKKFKLDKVNQVSNMLKWFISFQ